MCYSVSKISTGRKVLPPSSIHKTRESNQTIGQGVKLDGFVEVESGPNQDNRMRLAGQSCVSNKNILPCV